MNKETPRSPFRNIGPQEKKTGKKEVCRQKYEGNIYPTNQGYYIKVVDYMDRGNVMVEFTHDGFFKIARIRNVLAGEVAYPFHPNIYGGFYGVGFYDSFYRVNGKRIHGIWENMLRRAAEPTCISNKSYEKVSVCNEWLNFQTFAHWYEVYNSLLSPDPNLALDYHIDKDIFQWGFEEKVYSPATCCIIPANLNEAIAGLQKIERKEEFANLPKGVTTNGSNGYSVNCSLGQGIHVHLGTFSTPKEAFLVYKKAKEDYIKSLADQYLSIGAILPNVHEALYKIEVKPFG